MTLYLDASALTKAYLIELNSMDVVAAIAEAENAATSAISYAEVRAALARSVREGRIDAETHAASTATLDTHWEKFVVVALDHTRLHEAGDVVDRHSKHALRALDAIHLASALRIAEGAPATITFACWDLRLWRAARDEGFAMLPLTPPS